MIQESTAVWTSGVYPNGIPHSKLMDASRGIVGHSNFRTSSLVLGIQPNSYIEVLADGWLGRGQLYWDCGHAHHLCAWSPALLDEPPNRTA